MKQFGDRGERNIAADCGPGPLIRRRKGDVFPQAAWGLTTNRTPDGHTTRVLMSVRDHSKRIALARRRQPQISMDSLRWVGLSSTATPAAIGRFTFWACGIDSSTVTWKPSRRLICLAGRRRRGRRCWLTYKLTGRAPGLKACLAWPRTRPKSNLPSEIDRKRFTSPWQKAGEVSLGTLNSLDHRFPDDRRFVVDDRPIEPAASLAAFLLLAPVKGDRLGVLRM